MKWVFIIEIWYYGQGRRLLRHDGAEVGAGDRLAFALVSGGLLLLGGFEIWLFGRLSWP